MNAKKPTAGIILAAGLSKRLGRPKQLIHINDRPLLGWVLDAALNSMLECIVLVLGHNAPLIQKVLSKRLDNNRVRTIINNRHQEGISQSLRAGLVAAMDRFPSVMFLLGDQPLVDSGLIDLLLTRFRQSAKDICVPSHKGHRGNPCLFSRKYYDQLLSLQGDIGARNIIKANPGAVLSVEVADPSIFQDIDTEKDLDGITRTLDPGKS